MKAYKVVNKDGKLESYYLVCYSSERCDKYQLVSLPWRRVDHRFYDSEEEAITDLQNIVYDNRKSTVTAVDLNINEVGIA